MSPPIFPKKLQTCSRRSDNTVLNFDRRSTILEMGSRLKSTRVLVSVAVDFYLSQ